PAIRLNLAPTHPCGPSAAERGLYVLRKPVLDVSATEARLFINDAFRRYAYDLSSNRGRKLLCGLPGVKRVYPVSLNLFRRRKNTGNQTTEHSRRPHRVKNIK